GVMERVNDLLDGKLPSSNPQNEAYRHLLIAACNALHRQFPFLFEKINDYTELLLPADLTSEFSIVHDVVQGMPAEDCQQVEIIGWLYQFYISEKKDAVFASKGKVKKEDIPAATQLFTPRWIVEYMVQNTLGKLWLQNRPQSRLREHMPYFIESPNEPPTNHQPPITTPEELTLLDQACGSGHILVYAFESLTKIYEEEGYSPGDIPKLIIEKNLHGFEIDERAAQLAGFSLLMKARGYYRRLFRKEVPVPNILLFEDVKFGEGELDNYLQRMKLDMFSQDLKADLLLFEQATNYGSLMRVRTRNLPALQDSLPPADLFLADTHRKVLSALRQMEALSRKFHCVVDNPPYMGSGNMNPKLAQYVKTNYPESKADLMACFMEAGWCALLPNGYLGMINQHSWMFLSSYEKLRSTLIEGIFFDTLLHLGPRTFPEIGGEVVQNAAFTFWNKKPEGKGTYLRLVEEGSSEAKRTKTLEAIQNPDCGWRYTANQKDFEKIPGSPVGYWLGRKVFDLFLNNESLDNFVGAKLGMRTGNNLRFLRSWFEVEIFEISF
ncbi:MAG: BREX-1 system adenine-specific DNA-methyltransferase PglX, partial [Bacteroidetes bacterium]